MVFLLARDFGYGSATFLERLMDVQPFLTVAATVLVAGHRSGAASWPEMASVLASAPVGNAGYLLGRWLAMVSILLPVTALPVLLAAGLAAAAGSEPAGPAAWAGSWALRVAPLVPATSAMWLGLVTIAGGETAALAAWFAVVGIAVKIANQLLLPLHLVVEASLTYGSFADLMTGIRWLPALAGASRVHMAPRFAASEAPFDARAVAEWRFPQMAVGVSLAALVLGLAVAWVRRTRRDLRPRTVRPDHPLRTYLEALLRLRERLAPAAGLDRRDRLAMACGLLLFAGGVAASFERQTRFRELAGERFETETGDPFAPLPAGVTPRSWKVRGVLGSSGEVDLDVRGVLVNESGDAQGRLSFSLNEHLEISDVEAMGRRVSIERAWDRVRLAVDPPLSPGETLELRWRLGGAPAAVRFHLWGRSTEGFYNRFQRFRQARFSRELSDLSLSRTYRAVSPRRVQLDAADLTPVPRYTPWTLAAADRGGGSTFEVPAELVRPPVELEIDLAAPAAFLADSCGHWSRAKGEGTRLAGSCRTPLADYFVYGGPLRVVENEGIVFAVLAHHISLAAEHAESLAAAARLADEAWPGTDGLEGMAVAEWIRQFERHEDLRWQWGPGWTQYRLRGKLLLMSEESLGNRLYFGGVTASGGEALVADLMTRDLVSRRAFEPSQELFVRRAIEALMLQRMGVSRQRDATVTEVPGLRAVLERPLLEAGQFDSTHWSQRLPAVLFDLAARVGASTLFEVFDEFLSSSAAEPATAKELVELLERRSGVSLARFYDDFIAGGAMPKLALAGVVSRREEPGFRVFGEVVNHGTGEVYCPVVVKTEVAAVTTLVAIGSESATRFEVRTPTAPFAVELDPAGTCHRMVSAARFAAEHVDLSD